MRKLLALALVFMLVLGVSTAAYAGKNNDRGGGNGGSTFEGSINVSGETALQVGQSTTLTAAWETNRDVTRYQWSIDEEGQGEVTIQDDEKQEGSSQLVFTATEAGEYVVCFKIWHHADPVDRCVTECVTITVTEPEEEGCPAAPAIANAYLDSIGFSGDRGEIISSVTAEMGRRATFQGYEKCDPEYEQAAIDFVKAYLEANSSD